MAEKIIQNPSITTNVFEYDGAGRVSAISGHPLAGEGGGEVVKSDLMWKPTVESDGYVHWTLTSSATTPEAAYISGAQGPQGPSGTNGTDGTDGISPTFTITPTAGGTRVTISGAQGEEGFDVLSGAKGADGADGAAGFSPTVTLIPVNSDESHNNGGTQVEITYKNGESTATTAYTAWNGNDGEGASVNLFGNNGVSVTKDGTSYTLGLSGGYYSNTLSAGSAMSAGVAKSADSAHEAQGFRWGDDTYQDTSAALNNLWAAKNHVTLLTANNILTVDNNDSTSATLSAMSYISNTGHAGWLPQKSCVCQSGEIYNMSLLADGQGMLFFVVSAN